MIINAIIAEYNPFHKGHKLQLERAKQKTGADYTIVIMSGSFVQRGTPAILDKFLRTEMALKCGADLVLELPVCYSCSSAEYFAFGAVTLADKLSVVDNLCFGSESGDPEVLSRIAKILENEPDEYKEYLRQNIRLGLSFPIARTSALIQYDNSLAFARDVLATPNNILGIEYIKALNTRNSRISPITTKRIGLDFHDHRFGVGQCSSKAIRDALFNGNSEDYLKNEMPSEAFEILSDNIDSCIFPDDFSEMLYYKLLMERNEGYMRFLDVSNDLSDRIIKKLPKFRSFTDFCDTLKTKEITYTRISRILMHILLDITDNMMVERTRNDYIPYVRVLGFKEASKEVLTRIKNNSSLPIITKLADTQKAISKDAYSILMDELKINDIYLGALAMKTNTPLKNEISTPIVKL